MVTSDNTTTPSNGRVPVDQTLRSIADRLDSFVFKFSEQQTRVGDLEQPRLVPPIPPDPGATAHGNTATSAALVAASLAALQTGSPMAVVNPRGSPPDAQGDLCPAFTDGRQLRVGPYYPHLPPPPQLPPSAFLGTHPEIDIKHTLQSISASLAALLAKPLLGANATSRPPMPTTAPPPAVVHPSAAPTVAQTYAAAVAKPFPSVAAATLQPPATSKSPAAVPPVVGKREMLLGAATLIPAPVAATQTAAAAKTAAAAHLDATIVVTIELGAAGSARAATLKSEAAAMEALLVASTTTSAATWSHNLYMWLKWGYDGQQPWPPPSSSRTSCISRRGEMLRGLLKSPS